LGTIERKVKGWGGRIDQISLKQAKSAAKNVERQRFLGVIMPPFHRASLFLVGWDYVAFTDMISRFGILANSLWLVVMIAWLYVTAVAAIHKS